MKNAVTIVGGGLAGCEAAWQLATRGHPVRLVEMKPVERTPAQTATTLAELVCSNSLRSANPMNAVGLLKIELQRLGSLVIGAAHATRVPAGDALAVDREQFSALIDQKINSHPLIERVQGRVDALPTEAQGLTIIATGPLTTDRLATDIVKLTGNERLYFYDAIAPVVAGDSINREVVYAASRYDKGAGDDYLNCPLNEAQYRAFVDALCHAEYMPLHSFEEPRYFQGCLPVEVMAHSGPDTLRYGTMKPVGLHHPVTGARAFAVVQLRKEDKAGQAYNLVGFQTKMTHPEQRRVFRMLPGLEAAEFLRLGAIHRNTYLDSPTLLDDRMRLVRAPHLRFAGQITGVEGYVESTAHGLLVGLLLARELAGLSVVLPPATCALGALAGHVLGHSRLPGRAHEPQNIHWGLFPPPPTGTKKRNTKDVRLLRAIHDFDAWAQQEALPLEAMPPLPPPHPPKPKGPRKAPATPTTTDAS